VGETCHLQLSGLEIRVGSKVLVQDLALSLESGWILGLVGSSGSGKTLTARSLSGLVDLNPGVVKADLEIRTPLEVFRPYQAALGAPQVVRDRAFSHIRGRWITYLPQDSRGALNPLWTVQQHLAISALSPDLPVADALRRVGFPEPRRVLPLYPHELSGGMAQRVAIAQALLRGSRFLIADEPTTALDPTLQQEVLDVLRGVVATGVGLLLITHDLRLLPGFADEVAVMSGGRMVERTHISTLQSRGFEHPAAQELLEATRRIAAGRLG